MKRIAAGVWIVCVLFLFGCSPKPAPMPEEVSYKIALGIGAMEHPVHRMVQHGFLAATDNMKVTAVISGLDEGSAKNLQEKWQSAVVDHDVQGMLLWSGDDTFYSFMREMKASHGTVFVIPHFRHEYMDTKNFISANIYTEGRKQGEMAADQMIEALVERGITSGSIGIARTGDITDVIIDGFCERMAEMAPQYTVLPWISTGLDVDGTLPIVVSFIEENPDMVAGFGTGTHNILSWLGAAEQAGRTDLVVVGGEYTDASLNAMNEGTVAALVCADYYKEGYDGAKALVRILGGDVPKTEDEWRQTYDPVVITKVQNYERYRTIVDSVINP